MAKKFTHEEAYRGDDFLDKLSNKTLVICGAGALGSNLVDMLSRQGVSSIRVIDMDRVDEHNVNTQVYGDQDVGAMKVNALRNRIFRDTGVAIDVFEKELKSGNAKKALKNANLVIDAFDNKESRQILHDYCSEKNVPCLHAGMFESYGEVVWNDCYQVPKNAEDGDQDVCDYPLSRSLVMMVVTILTEEILDFCLSDNPRKKSWSLTLKDLKIESYR